MVSSRIILYTIWCYDTNLARSILDQCKVPALSIRALSLFLEPTPQRVGKVVAAIQRPLAQSHYGLVIWTNKWVVVGL